MAALGYAFFGDLCSMTLREVSVCMYIMSAASTGAVYSVVTRVVSIGVGSDLVIFVVAAEDGRGFCSWAACGIALDAVISVVDVDA